MTVPGVDLPSARRILAARDARGFFRSIEELSEAGLPRGAIASFTEMSLLPPGSRPRAHFTDTVEFC